MDGQLEGCGGKGLRHGVAGIATICCGCHGRVFLQSSQSSGVGSSSGLEDLIKKCNKHEGKAQTSGGGCVTLCGLAGRPRPYSVHAVHAETIVDVAVQLEDG